MNPIELSAFPPRRQQPKPVQSLRDRIDVPAPPRSGPSFWQRLVRFVRKTGDRS